MIEPDRHRKQPLSNIIQRVFLAPNRNCCSEQYSVSSDEVILSVSRRPWFSRCRSVVVQPSGATHDNQAISKNQKVTKNEHTSSTLGTTSQGKEGKSTKTDGKLSRSRSHDKAKKLSRRSSHDKAKKLSRSSSRDKSVGSSNNSSDGRKTKKKKTKKKRKKSVAAKELNAENDRSTIMRSIPMTPDDPELGISPHDFLEDLLIERGYSIRRYETLKSAYHNKPTPYQVACYGVHIVNVVKKGDVDTLDALIQCGISPDACNTFGQSIAHMACRLGHFQMLQVLIDHGCTIQIADEHGKTPLHDICWTMEPSFDALTMILEIDCHMLFLQDARGHVPLSYVREDQWRKWIKFLDSKKDEFWPRVRSVGESDLPLVELRPNSRPIRDPSYALPTQLATMVAAGSIKPDEVDYLLKPDSSEENMNSSVDDISSDSDSDSYSDSDDDDSDDSISSLDLLLSTLPIHPKAM